MNPLRIAAGVVSLLSEMVAREYRRVQFPHWPDGEAPLIDDGIAEVWATVPQQASAESAEPEAGVDVAEKVPTPGRAHTPGVGHLPCAHPFGYDHPCARCGHSGGNMPIHPDALKDSLVAHPTLGDWYREVFQRGEPDPDRPKVTSGLLISAAIGLREFAESESCETPTFWRSIASQLDPK